MLVEKNISDEVANILLSINAVKLQPSNPFTWSSGKLAPIYCDNRLLLSYVQQREAITDFFCEIIKKKFNDLDVIAAVATGGIPHGMLIANKLKCSFVYIRNKPKEHGQKNMIEGLLENKSKVVVLEDLVSTGKSSMKAVDAIRDQNCEILALLSIFSYEFFKLDSIDFPYYSLCNYNTLIEVAFKKNIISDSEKIELKNWHQSQLV
tara:strand:- start:365 stop:985 length:621 start_codon:yes stop_codon:yes gene_type:complete